MEKLYNAIKEQDFQEALKIYHQLGWKEDEFVSLLLLANGNKVKGNLSSFALAYQNFKKQNWESAIGSFDLLNAQVWFKQQKYKEAFDIYIQHGASVNALACLVYLNTNSIKVDKENHWEYLFNEALVHLSQSKHLNALYLLNKASETCKSQIENTNDWKLENERITCLILSIKVHLSEKGNTKDLDLIPKLVELLNSNDLEIVAVTLNNLLVFLKKKNLLTINQLQAWKSRMNVFWNQNDTYTNIHQKRIIWKNAYLILKKKFISNLVEKHTIQISNSNHLKLKLDNDVDQLVQSIILNKRKELLPQLKNYFHSINEMETLDTKNLESCEYFLNSLDTKKQKKPKVYSNNLDPERWIPKKHRSNYKSKKNSKGAQGSV